MTLGCKTSGDVMKAIKDQGVEMVDFRFTDVPGMWQHTSYPAQVFEEDALDDGLGFDGSSIRGFKVINESDMLMMPDPTTAFIDPFMSHKTLVMICDIKDPVTKEFYPRDPRGIAKKAEAYLKSSGVGDTAYFGPEAEFFVFDNVRYGPASNIRATTVDSQRGPLEHATGTRAPTSATRSGPRKATSPCPPTDTLQDLRTEMALTMIGVGLTVECQHHEVATGGPVRDRHEVRLAAGDGRPPDEVQVRRQERRRASTARPRPSCPSRSSATTARACTATSRSGRAASRCSPTLPATPACRRCANGTSAACCGTPRRSCAFAAPTTNSYRRLVPGYEAPVNLAWSCATARRCCRIPMYSDSPKAKRVEFRCPDPSCNPYLAFAAMLMAGLDGIKNKIEPGEPVDKNIYDLPPEEAAEIKKVPGSLEASLAALEADHEFLLEGDVFTADLIATYIDYKRATRSTRSACGRTRTSSSCTTTSRRSGSARLRRSGRRTTSWAPRLAGAWQTGQGHAWEMPHWAQPVMVPRLGAARGPDRGRRNPTVGKGSLKTPSTKRWPMMLRERSLANAGPASPYPGYP